MAGNREGGMAKDQGGSEGRRKIGGREICRRGTNKLRQVCRFCYPRVPSFLTRNTPTPPQSANLLLPQHLFYLGLLSLDDGPEFCSDLIRRPTRLRRKALSVLPTAGFGRGGRASANGNAPPSRRRSTLKQVNQNFNKFIGVLNVDKLNNLFTISIVVASQSSPPP